MKKTILPLVAMLLLLAIGCSEQKSTAPDQTNQGTEQATVDPIQVVEEHATTEWSAPQAAPGFQAQLDSIDTSYDAYALVFIWGQCAKPRDSIAVSTDWSGSVSMNAEGYLKLRHAIRFERGQDSIYPPTDSVSVSWKSFTSLDVDGLGLLVLVKRGVTYVVAPKISFGTAPFSIEIPVDSLARLNAFFRIDEHNGIVIFARQLPRRICPHGGILGVWHRDSTGNNGPFEGLWLRGEPVVWPMPHTAIKVGKVHGRFVLTNDGQRLFHGRYTDTDGVEIGDVFGEWMYDDPTMCPQCGQGHARFKGRFTRDGQGEVGFVEGELGFGPGPTMHRMDMPMRGRWWMECKNTDSNTGESVN